MKIFGGILLALGILIAGLSGLCSLIVGGASVLDGSSQEAMSMLPAVLIVGGIPFAIGIGLFFLGRHLMRSADKELPTDDAANKF